MRTWYQAVFLPELKAKGGRIEKTTTSKGLLHSNDHTKENCAIRGGSTPYPRLGESLYQAPSTNTSTNKDMDFPAPTFWLSTGRVGAGLYTSKSKHFYGMGGCILHTWALWAGSVNLVTAQEFWPVYYCIWAYTVVLHALTLTSRVFLCALP